MSKKILITGASGFIGGFIVEKALALGMAVTVTMRPRSDRSRLSDPRIQFLVASLEDETALTAQLRDAGTFDYVIHNAGITKALHATEYREVNAENTRRLANALQASGSENARFLLVSSLAAVGQPLKKGALIQGAQTPNPVTAYGASKLQAEQYLAAMPRLDWTAVQPTAVYGPADRDIFVFFDLIKKGFEMHIGTRPQKLSFIYVHDLVDVIFLALQSPQATGKKYLITDGKDYTNDDLGKYVAAAVGRKPMLKIRIPLGIVYVLAFVSENVARLRKKPSPLNREKLNELGAESWLCDSTPAQQELGFRPQYDLDSGTKMAATWYRQNGWL